MGAVELLGLAASISLLAGWRLYLCVFVTGLAMRSEWIALPHHLEPLGAFANNWVLAAAAVGLVAEFLADKIPWLDSAWDAVHGFVRPVGGALLSLAIVDAGDPAWQIIVFLLGGGGAMLSHGAKASTRALVNVSPEPVSNVILSGVEDTGTAGMLALAFVSPAAALFVAVVAAGFAIVVLIYARKALRALLGLRDRAIGRGPPPD
jgi:hypothetical protein